MYLFKVSITTQVQSQTKNKTPFFNESIKYVFEYIRLLGLTSIALVLPALQFRASWIAAIRQQLLAKKQRSENLQFIIKNIFFIN
ncbi:hypothetical protein AR687_24275 [Flavobacteriaceae bacterium CRH]|nr:hypothetical protein AR687_24275 [Flavobacteriaceae bacterium CRH]